MEITDQRESETIDFAKLAIILRNNWLWIVLIFLTINLAAYLLTRYTKNLYQSSSEIKLDVKTDASELGISEMVEDQYMNIVAGEIEIIKSKLFLNRVLDRSAFDISFISVGHVLSEEMFRRAPASVEMLSSDPGLYNVQIKFEEKDTESFTLTPANTNKEMTGRYGDVVQINNLKLILIRNPNFVRGDEVGYYFIINSREVLLDYLSKNLTAEPLNFSARTIRVSFQDHNPQKAQAILNKIDTLYLQYSNEQKNLANKQKIEWLSSELTRIEKRMEDYENYFEEFTLKNKTNNLDENLRNTILSINQVDSQRYELTRRIRETERYISAIEAKNLNTPISIRTSLPEVVIKNIDALLESQLEQEKMKLSYNEKTFAYREKAREIQLLESKTLDQLNQLKSEWANRLDGLNKRKQLLEEEFEDFPDKNTEFTKNQRFYKLYEEFYLTLMQSRSQFEIAQAGTTPDFKILSPASYPAEPISPNRLMIAGIGIVASIVVNFFFIGILYLANNKITGLQELEKLQNIPVIGAIPAARSTTATGIHVTENPRSMVSEAIRSLRTNLDFFNPNSEQKIVAVSSTVSGEGKSFLAMNLGAVLALSKKRVVLLDLDMRKAKTGGNGLDDLSKGISTILIRKNSWQECLKETTLTNFHLLPSGPHPPNPSELLLNGEFEDLLNDLKTHYDFIIMDTPPVGLVTDGIMAMRKADVSLYVFRANYSKREFISNLKRIIQLNKFHNLTTVLNAVPASGKTYGYGYYEEKSESKFKSFFN